MREARLERSGSRITQTKTFAGPISMKKKTRVWWHTPIILAMVGSLK
jgi:hypothetical protein